MPYYIKHLIRAKDGLKWVDFKQVIVETCKSCKKEVPQIYFGIDRKSICAVEAVYKYTAMDIIEEHSNLKKGMAGVECKKVRCNRIVYH